MFHTLYPSLFCWLIKVYVLKALSWPEVVTHICVVYFNVFVSQCVYVIYIYIVYIFVHTYLPTHTIILKSCLVTYFNLCLKRKKTYAAPLHHPKGCYSYTGGKKLSFHTPPGIPQPGPRSGSVRHLNCSLPRKTWGCTLWLSNLAMEKNIFQWVNLHTSS